MKLNMQLDNVLKTSYKLHLLAQSKIEVFAFETFAFHTFVCDLTAIELDCVGTCLHTLTSIHANQAKSSTHTQSLSRSYGHR